MCLSDLEHIEIYEAFLFISQMEYYKNLDLKDIIYINDEGLVCWEQWKDIPDYNGYYQISNLGRIKYTGKMYTDSLGRNTPKKARIRIQTLTNTGYLFMILRKNNKNVSVRIHRTVAQVFIPNYENKCCVNHINTIKTDNTLHNLEWCTIRENSKHWIENDSSQSSNYIGVTRNKNKWAANISIEGKVFNLGKHFSEEVAYEKYQKALSEWEDFKIKPKDKYRSPELSSVYEGVYYSADRDVWCAQFKKGSSFFFVGNFSTELEAKNARDLVVTEYEETGVFPIKTYASKYMHITWKESISKWQVRVPMNGKRHYIGVYENEDDAGEAVRITLNLENKLYKKNYNDKKF